MENNPWKGLKQRFRINPQGSHIQVEMENNPWKEDKTNAGSVPVWFRIGSDGKWKRGRITWTEEMSRRFYQEGIATETALRPKLWESLWQVFGRINRGIVTIHDVCCIGMNIECACITLCLSEWEKSGWNSWRNRRGWTLFSIQEKGDALNVLIQGENRT